MKILCSCDHKNGVSQEHLIRLNRDEVSIKTVCASFLVTLVTPFWESRCYKEKRKKKTCTYDLARAPWRKVWEEVWEGTNWIGHRVWPRGKSWVLQTTVPSAALGTVSVSNKLNACRTTVLLLPHFRAPWPLQGTLQALSRDGRNPGSDGYTSLYYLHSRSLQKSRPTSFHF